MFTSSKISCKQVQLIIVEANTQQFHIILTMFT